VLVIGSPARSRTPLRSWPHTLADEGIMVTGTTTNEVDEQIQANIIAVGYKTIPGRK